MKTLAERSLGIAFLLISFPGFTQTTEETRPVADTLERIVVTGQFRPQSADRSIYKIKVIGGSEIKLKAANNLGELLRTEPGFQLRSDGILGDFIRIRGLSGEHVKILIDGMPVTGRMADRIDLAQLTLENADHIEIIEGPMSVVYGSNALAGAINIITRDYTDDLIHVEAETYYETPGTWNFNLNGARKFQSHTMNLHGARNFFQGWGPADTSRYKTWKPKRQYIMGAGYLFSRGKIRINLNTDYLNEELRDQGALTVANLYEKALDSYHYTERWNNRFNFINRGNDNFVVNFQAGYSYYEKRKITWLNDLVNLKKNKAGDANLHDTTKFHMISARGFVSNIPGRKLEYQAGYDLNFESANGKRTGGNRHVYEISGFMNFIYRPLTVLSIQPGLRVMAHSGFKAPLIYGLSVDYRPGPVIIKTAYAKGFRAPSLKQLYLEFLDNNHEIHGNENLRPETADNFSFSAQYNHFINRHMVSLEAGMFYNALKDAVQLAISLQQPGWGKYFNVDQGTYKTGGFEAAVHYRYSPGVFVNAGITNTGRLIPGDSESAVWSTDVTLSAGWKISDMNLEMGVFYKYNGKYPEFAGNYDPLGELQGVEKQVIPGYHILDLTLAKKMAGSRIQVSAGVKNVLNVTSLNSVGNLNIHGSVDNELSLGYGRVFFIKAAYNFSKNYLQ